MTLARAFLIHDRIEDDIAIDTAQLHGKNHPADLELDAELVGQRLAELEFEAAANRRSCWRTAASARTQIQFRK